MGFEIPMKIDILSRGGPLMDLCFCRKNKTPDHSRSLPQRWGSNGHCVPKFTMRYYYYGVDVDPRVVHN